MLPMPSMLPRASVSPTELAGVDGAWHATADPATLVQANGVFYSASTERAAVH